MHRFRESSYFASTARRVCALLALVAVGLVLVGSALGTAHAHELPQERTVLVQVSKTSVEVMIVYLEPPGPSVDLLMKRFDLNKDGELTGPEARLAGGEWIRRVLHGLQFEVAGEKPRAREPEIKFRVEKKGSLSAAVYARWDLESLPDHKTRTVHVRLLRQPENVPTEVTFQGDENTKITAIELPERFRGAPIRPVLAPGEQTSVRVRLTDTPSSSSPSD